MVKLNLPSSAGNFNDSNLINSPTLEHGADDAEAGSKTTRANDRHRNQSSEYNLEF